MPSFKVVKFQTKLTINDDFEVIDDSEWARVQVNVGIENVFIPNSNPKPIPIYKVRSANNLVNMYSTHATHMYGNQRNFAFVNGDKFSSGADNNEFQ